MKQPHPSLSKTVVRASVWPRLWSLMSGFRVLYLSAIGAVLVATVLRYLVPLVGRATIDGVLSDEPDLDGVTAYILQFMGGAEVVGRHLWIPGFCILGVTLLAGIFTFIKDRGTAYATDGIVRKLKNRIYDHLQKLSVRYHDRADSGDLIQRSTSDVETLRMALATQVVEVSEAAILMLTAIPVMFVLDERMTLVSFVLLIPMIAFGALYFARVKHIFREIDEAEGKVTTIVQENLHGLRVVRAFGRKQFEIDKFREPNLEFRDKQLKMLRLMAWYWSISDWISLLQNGLGLILGIYWVQNGTLSIGTLFAFLMFLNILIWPVRQMGRTLTELGKAQVALSRIGDILEEAEESSPPVKAASLGNFTGQITFDQVSFGHTADTGALKNISFTVKPGETLAILGPSGAGKSTLMHLLLRLYDHDEGSIFLDEVDLKTLDRKDVRSLFSVVMQEPFLYSKTIRENIRQGSADANDNAIMDAARMAVIDDTILRFPNGYDTLVGERGVTLSGGQRQRVALARALLHDAPVLLLDDAMSAVDAETEASILEALKSRHGRRTTLVIAHRVSTLAHADRILVLKEGSILQQGTHQELIAQEGLYQRLWELQSRLEEEFSAEQEIL